MFSAVSTLTIMVLSEKKVVDEFIGCWHHCFGSHSLKAAELDW